MEHNNNKVRNAYVPLTSLQTVTHATNGTQQKRIRNAHVPLTSL